jgi:hypothetical protein
MYGLNPGSGSRFWIQTQAQALNFASLGSPGSGSEFLSLWTTLVMRYDIYRVLRLTRMSNASFQFRVQFSLITISVNEFC